MQKHTIGCVKSNLDLRKPVCGITQPRAPSFLPSQTCLVLLKAQQQQQQTLDDATQEEDYDSGAGREAVVPADEEGEGGAGLAAETRND